MPLYDASRLDEYYIILRGATLWRGVGNCILVLPFTTEAQRTLRYAETLCETPRTLRLRGEKLAGME